jgi:hypothetical protein
LVKPVPAILLPPNPTDMQGNVVVLSKLFGCTALSIAYTRKPLGTPNPVGKLILKAPLACPVGILVETILVFIFKL